MATFNLPSSNQSQTRAKKSIARRKRNAASTKKKAVSAPKSAGKAIAAGRARDASPSIQKRSPNQIPSLAALSTAALAAELRRRESQLPKLEQEATRLRTALAVVEAQIAALGGLPATAVAAATRASPAVVHAGKKAGNKASAGKASVGKASAGKSAPSHRRGGKPTIAEHIVALLGERNTVLSPTDITKELAKRLSRAASPSFGIQIALTLRRLVNTRAIVQPGRGEYAAKESAVAAAV